jgi:hypothetical protein
MAIRSCVLRGCCANYRKGERSRCSCMAETILDCFVDAQDDGMFRLSSLCTMGD